MSLGRPRFCRAPATRRPEIGIATQDFVYPLLLKFKTIADSPASAEATMGMAFGSFLRRSLTPLLLSTALAACSVDGLAPSARIDNDSQVSAISPTAERMPRRMLERRVAEPMVEMGDTGGSETDYSSMQSMGARSGDARQTMDGMRAATPSVEDGGLQQTQTRRQRLPMIDSDEASAALSEPDSGVNGTMGVQPLRVPEGGVNMDEALGVGGGQPVTGLAQEQALEIAEGGTAEPVVDGIGMDNPVQMSQPAALPDTEVQQEVDGQAPVWEDQSRVVVPRRTRSLLVDDEQQIAMLPRTRNPMSLPQEDDQQSEVMPASERSCRAALQKMGVVFSDIPRISDGATCGVAYPIELRGLSGGIKVKPATKLNCQVTLAFAKWVKYELAPSARGRYWSGIQTIVPLGGYSCRRMNSSSRNPWSEHAKGNAIDVGKFVLKNGKAIDVRKKGFFAFREKGLLKAVRSDSCKYFSTVLGPGSDPHHKDHFHFDLRTRKTGYRHCD